MRRLCVSVCMLFADAEIIICRPLMFTIPANDVQGRGSPSVSTTAIDRTEAREVVYAELVYE
jgi:hypothetical protein